MLFPFLKEEVTTSQIFKLYVLTAIVGKVIVFHHKEPIAHPGTSSLVPQLAAQESYHC